MRTSRFAALLSTLAFSTVAPSALAQPAGWTSSTPLGIHNPNAELTDQQARFVVDTATLIADGKMSADGADIRIGASCDGGTLLPYWVQPGTINTASTEIWIKGTIPAGHSQYFLFSGNPAATSAQVAIDAMFDGDAQNGNLPSTGTNAVTGLGAGGVGNSQRGYRFAPLEDVLVVGFGKNEPTGTTRYVTLFDFGTQQKLAQSQIAGPAAQWSYGSISPLWLRAGTHYTVQLYQGGSDGYYYGSSTSINQRLQLFDMRYCNSCTQDTFPTNILTGMHYGTPDIQFLTYKHPAQPLEQESAVCVNTALCDADCTPASCGDGFANNVAGEACDDGNASDNDACTSTCAAATCGDQIVQANVEQCDDGNDDDTDGCLSTCMSAKCGDGKVRAGVEECDDGNNVDSDGCLSSCKIAKCGDGKVRAGFEECDDANDDDTDGCLSTCKAAKCGDGKVQAGLEECDDGNDSNDDGCTTACLFPRSSPGTKADAGATDAPFDPTAPVDEASGCRSAPTSGNGAAGLAVIGLSVALLAKRRRRRH